uniref:hypothetical protein n=1 Tax=uncultured Draconibacterium sp. TaxID=1573823 RepID=UPI00321692E2
MKNIKHVARFHFVFLIVCQMFLFSCESKIMEEVESINDITSNPLHNNLDQGDDARISVWPAFNGRLLETAKSVQGLRNRSNHNKIWINKGEDMDWPTIYENYGHTQSVSIQPATVDGLMQVIYNFRDVFNGYILYDYNSNPVSLYIALSLAGPMNAAVVDVSIEQHFITKFGNTKPLIEDVTGRTYTWLFNNHKDKFEKNGIVLKNNYNEVQAADLAVRLKWPIVTTYGRVDTEKWFKYHMDTGGLVAGWVPAYFKGKEDDVIKYYSGFGLDLVAGLRTSHNLSVKYKIDKFKYTQPDYPSSYAINANKHYVALYAYSGGNIKYLNGRFLTDTGANYDSDDWINRNHTVPITWSIAPRAVELSPIPLQEIYSRRKNEDMFVAAYSGHSYIHPSHYSNLTAFTDKMVPFLQKADLHYVSIQDPSTTITQSWVNDYGNLFLEKPQVKGLYVQSTNTIGQIFEGANGKPVVTRRLGMRIEGSQTNMNNFINVLNNLQPNINNASGYTVISVDLEKTSVQDCQTLADSVDDHIEFVTMDELFYHIRNQLF